MELGEESISDRGFWGRFAAWLSEEKKSLKAEVRFLRTNVKYYEQANERLNDLIVMHEIEIDYLKRRREEAEESLQEYTNNSSIG